MTRTHGSTFVRVMAALLVVPFVLALLAAWLVRDTPTNPPDLEGRVWHAQHDGANLLVYVTREERSKSVPVLHDPGDVGFEPYARFELFVRRAADGALMQSALLGDFQHVDDAKAPRIIGIVGSLIWLWTDGLEARRIPDLALYATEQTLIGRVVEAPEMLPIEPSGYTVMPDPVALVARGRDARFYRIDPEGRGIEPFDPSTLPATTSSTRPEDRFNALEPPGRGRAITHPSNVLQKSFLTSTGLWYALLSDSERSELSRWPNAVDPPSGDVARTLHRTTYRLDDRRGPEIDPSSLTSLRGERLIQAGFLIRGPTAVWDVPDPSSSLVMARRQLGADEPWEVLRLARDGAVLWRTSTLLAEPFQLVDLGSHIGFVGTEPSVDGTSPSGRGHLVVWIDQASGSRRSLSIATGLVR